MARHSLEGEIAATRWLQEIREAQAALDGIEMDERVRKTVRRCLAAEFAEAVERVEDLTLHENDGKKWTPAEDEAISGYLREKPRPPDWREDSHEHWTQRRILAVELSGLLKRSEKSVEKRALALGFSHFTGF